ncbi:hypothetical protein ACRALDRAFT_1083796, partial [Sodiomyces alcalophilus JCM 7366]|uniref:uncharacterized protein n=1 Tax=Sodiomyces alcalophilus JCM 7366 TaxID=591952 RepID=UPI0039B53448
MSGAEAATVVGLVTGIITLLGTIRSIHSGVKDARGLPEAFHQVAERLPLAQDTLKVIEAYIDDRIAHGDTCEAMRPTVEACKEKACRLEKIFEKVAPQPDASRLDRYRSVARLLGKGSRVESLMTGILADLQLLAQAHGLRATAVTAAEVDGKLADAIRELAEAPPSLPEPEDDVSITQSHWGSGHNIAGDFVQGSKIGSFSGTAYLGPVTQQVSADPVDRALRILRENPRTPARLRQRERVPRKTEGTCEWLAQDERYLQWRERDGSPVLWVSGGPGRGKTMLAISVVEDMERRKADDEVLLSFFCNNGDDDCNTPAAIWADLSCQLLDQRRHLVEHVLDHFAASGECRVSVATIFETLLRHLEQRVICVLDGLDECDVPETDLAQFLQKLEHIFSRGRRGNTAAAKLLIFSRDQPRCVGAVLAAHPSVDLEQDAAARVESDAKTHISAKMRELEEQGMLEKDQLQTVREYLEAHASGTFLWVGYVAFELSYKPWEEVEPILRSIPKDLAGVYERILGQIDDRLRNDKETAKRLEVILQWVVLSQRPLTVEELATATRKGDMGDASPEDVARDELHVRSIVSLCGYLIRIMDSAGPDRHGGEIHLLHQSAREYLLGHRGPRDAASSRSSDIFRVDRGKGHQLLADTCLTHIEDAFPKELLADQDVRMSSFLEYAVVHWPEHSRHVPSNPFLGNSGDPFDFSRAEDVAVETQAASDLWVAERRGGVVGASAVVVTEYFTRDKGILEHAAVTLDHLFFDSLFYSLFLHAQARTRAEERLRTRERSPLLRAVENGNCAIISLLLDVAKANVEGTDKDGRSPLSWAAERGREAVVALLLGAGAKVLARDKNGLTPLSWACEAGHGRVVELLLEGVGANLEELRGVDGARALLCAATAGHAGIVTMLLGSGIDPDAADNHGRTALI